MLVVALDVGTSSARARVFDAGGRALPGAEGHVAYEPITSADGGVELDPVALLEAIGDALDRCLAGAGARASDVAAVGASVFWHSLLALDRDGRPLTPVITWADPADANHLILGPAENVDRRGRVEESRDGGRTFKTVRVSHAVSPPYIPERGNFLFGDDLSSVDVDDAYVHVVWGDNRAGFQGTWYGRVPLTAY